MTENITWLTQEAYDRLAAELENLAGPYRAEIVDRIARARDEGDLKENGGYHAAREEQGKNEARILELTEKLRVAKVGTPPDDGMVEAGMVVSVEGMPGIETFLLGAREISDTTDLPVFSPSSPLGKAIFGKYIGETVAYTAPNGKEFAVTITGAKPYEG